MWYLTCPGVLTIVREILVSIIGGICCERLVIGVKKNLFSKITYTVRRMYAGGQDGSLNNIAFIVHRLYLKDMKK